MINHTETSDPDMVICPNCVHEFRAIPENFQSDMQELRANLDKHRVIRDEAIVTYRKATEALRNQQDEIHRLRAENARLKEDSVLIAERR